MPELEITPAFRRFQLLSGAKQNLRLAYAAIAVNTRDVFFVAEDEATAKEELKARSAHSASYVVQEVLVLVTPDLPVSRCCVVNPASFILLPPDDNSRRALRALDRLPPAEAEAIHNFLRPPPKPPTEGDSK